MATMSHLMRTATLSVKGLYLKNPKQDPQVLGAKILLPNRDLLGARYVRPTAMKAGCLKPEVPLLGWLLSVGNLF